MQTTPNFNGVAIVTVKTNGYRIYFLYLSQKTINLLRNVDLTEKNATL